MSELDLETKLDLLSIELKELAKIIDEIEQKAKDLNDKLQA